MARKTIANLNIQLGASSATLRKDFAGAAGAVRGLSGDVQRASVALNGLNAVKAKVSATVTAFATKMKAAAAGLVAMALAAAASTVGIRGVANRFEAIDSIAKAADRIGTTTEALIALQHAGDLAGVSAETIEKSLGKLLRTISEGQHGGKKAVATFDELGLSIKELATASPIEAFASVADALKKLPTDAERARLAFALFGKQGEDLLNLLAHGGDVIRESETWAQRLNRLYGRIDASKIEAANDAWSDAKGALIGVADQLAIAVAPAVEELGQKFTLFAVELSKTIETNRPLIDEFAKSVIASSATVLEGLSKILEVSRVWLETLSEAPRKLALIGEALGRVVNPIDGIRKFIAGTPLGGDFKVNVAADKAAQQQLDAEAEKKRIAQLEFAQLAELQEAASGLGKFLAEQHKQAAQENEEFEQRRQAELDREDEEWTRTGERIRESIATAFEKTVAAIEEAGEALRRGKIEPEDFKRAAGKAQADLLAQEKQELERRQKLDAAMRQQFQPVGAKLRGTPAGHSAVVQGQQAIRQLANEARQQSAWAKRSAELLGVIKEIMERNGNQGTVELTVNQVSL